MNDNPNKNWYRNISEQKSLLTHCPYASTERCPKYFQSISLYGDTGGTAISNKEEKRLLKKWTKSELWPSLIEQEPSLFKANEKLSFISNFCPEVTYRRFGGFCSNLSFYTDEIDREIAHQHLKEMGAENDNPLWGWSSFKAEHYSDCDLYSLIQLPKEANTDKAGWWKEHMAKIMVGILVTLAGVLFKLWLL